MPLHLSDRQMLKVLREIQPSREWDQLDEKRVCVLCEKSFRIRDARLAFSDNGHCEAHCPTPGCTGTPAHWVHAGNPLIDEATWSDWTQLMEQANDGDSKEMAPSAASLRRKPRRFSEHCAPAA